MQACNLMDKRVFNMQTQQTTIRHTICISVAGLQLSFTWVAQGVTLVVEVIGGKFYDHKNLILVKKKKKKALNHFDTKAFTLKEK